MQILIPAQALHADVHSCRCTCINRKIHADINSCTSIACRRTFMQMYVHAKLNSQEKIFEISKINNNKMILNCVNVILPLFVIYSESSVLLTEKGGGR